MIALITFDEKSHARVSPSLQMVVSMGFIALIVPSITVPLHRIGAFGPLTHASAEKINIRFRGQTKYDDQRNNARRACQKREGCANQRGI
jgi:hypothetical protein